MEIAGQKIFFPRNFLFFSRLPSRFEVLVVARGAVTGRGTAFELEVQGQRLVLNSKIDLKVGVRYDLEKISGTEFKILREKTEDSAKVTPAPADAKKDTATETGALGFFMPDPRSAYTDLLALKVLEDTKRKVEVKSDKFLFNLESEFALRGVFVPQGPGDYTLFVSGNSVNQADIKALAELVAGFGVKSVRQVNLAVLDRIAAGAVDLQS